MVLFEASSQMVNPATASPGRYTVPYPAHRPTRIHPYLVPDGNPLNNANFNQHKDNTRVSIMTPQSDDSGTNEQPKPKYPKRLEVVYGALKAYLGDDITITPYLYDRINTEVEEQDTDQRGLALFQYDPNADGNGQRQWRLFYENIYFYDTVLEDSDI
ncbi:hypothetical protein MBLNU459_g4196t1 [Dothideomycetes sp. NU459]